jgi:endonuclease/exonuclease/phosphatase family metal-dependent hydrolase
VQLKVVSYNVLMDANSELSQYPIEDLLYTEHRWPAVLKIIEHERADIIALQEGTAKFLEQLLQEEWVRRGYYISDYSGNSVNPMGNLILSRYPFSTIGTHMKRTRTLTGLSPCGPATQRSECTDKITACPNRCCWASSPSAISAYRSRPCI